MKFKGITIEISDKAGDRLRVEKSVGTDGALLFFVNDSTGVVIKRKKALKLAWAIIDELNPGYDTNV